MKRVFVVVAFFTSLLLVLLSADRPSALAPAAAATAPPGISAPAPTEAGLLQRLLRLAQAEDTAPPELKPFDEVIKDTDRVQGMLTLYRNRSKGTLYAEILPEQLNANFLCTITLESGIGVNGVYSGLPIADFLFNFKRVNRRVQFVVPNVYFRTRPDDPLQRSVKRGFSDSVLRALPIKSIHPERKSLLIDLEPLVTSDLPGLIPFLSVVLGSSYTLDTSKSYVGAVKGFPLNLELETIYGFTGGSSSEDLPAFVSTLPDSRSFNLRVRYSFSRLPENNGYRSRLADDRIGYFITAYQNLSDTSPRSPYVRYINRWHLEKQDPKAALSPPKKPIVFWIENTVPLEYRDAVRDGILMWNAAFEQAGFKDAIAAKQMPDKADWDPADVRYNTIRWLSSYDSGFLGLGPSRTNPLTGEILDADILIDANFARYMKQRYQTFSAQSMQEMSSLAKLTGDPDLCSYGIESHYLSQTIAPPKTLNPRLAFQLMSNYDLCFGMEATRQLGVGSMAIAMLQNATIDSDRMKQYVQEFLRTLIAHEVGHTLGLRHNFRASAMLSPTDLNNPEITHAKGLIGSVMDYAAVNLAPPGTPQGDYFTHRIGPYDAWAIAYGYTPSNFRTPKAETPFLEAIARRAAEPELAYATDEDRIDRLDPQTNAFDLSGDLLTYAPWQLENARQMWQRLDQRYPAEGEGYSDVRLMFDEIFDYYFQYSRFLTTYIGGQSFNRYRKGDAAGRLPFEPVSLDSQKQAIALLQKYVFDETQFRFSPEFLNKLAPSRWSHWGEDPIVGTLDYPIYDRILRLQAAILDTLFSNQRLVRLRDAELKTRSPALTLPDLFATLQTTIWQDVTQPQGKLQLSSLRRGLQREHLESLIRMVLHKSTVPDDARTVARYHLKQLQQSLDTTLKRHKEMDTLTRAHLEETSDRIHKALEAQLQTQ